MDFRQILGNALDYLGTGLNLPEYGYSERVAGARPTTFTGYTPQSQAKRLDTWRQVNFEQPKGGVTTPTQTTATPGYRSVSQNPVSPTPTLPTNTGGVDEVAKMDTHVTEWSNLAIQTFDLVKNIKERFTNGTIEQRKTILRVIGSNLTICLIYQPK